MVYRTTTENAFVVWRNEENQNQTYSVKQIEELVVANDTIHPSALAVGVVGFHAFNRDFNTITALFF